MDESPKVKVREAPRVSLNALSEYLVASAAGRRRIIQEQKRPKPFQVAYYSEAEDAIARYLASDDRNLLDLQLNFKQLQKGGKSPDWELGRRDTGIEALEGFKKLVPELPLNGLEVRRGPQKSRYLEVSGVTVSVRPEALLVQGTGDNRRLGAVKLYFSKSKPLSEERGRYASTILHAYLETFYTKVGVPDYRICMVIDVFAGKIHTAPRTYKRKRQDVEAACLEINLLWSEV